MFSLPILYSFRRCPYAMRARLALVAAGHEVELREILLRDKPKAMLDVSPKGTVPVLVLPDGTVVDESYDVMKWALKYGNNADWLAAGEQDTDELVDECDDLFKRALDRYKYPNRYPDEATPQGARNCDWEWRGACEVFIRTLEKRLSRTGYLFGKKPTLADYAIFPFVRQFAMTEADWWHDEAPYPKVKKWLMDFLDSDLFKHVMVRHDPWSEGDATILLK